MWSLYPILNGEEMADPFTDCTDAIKSKTPEQAAFVKAIAALAGTISIVGVDEGASQAAVDALNALDKCKCAVGGTGQPLCSRLLAEELQQLRRIIDAACAADQRATDMDDRQLEAAIDEEIGKMHKEHAEHYLEQAMNARDKVEFQLEHCEGQLARVLEFAEWVWFVEGTLSPEPETPSPE